MSTDLAVAPTAQQTERRGEWLAVHIFYASNNLPLLTECVLPLVRNLRAASLISGYFFIRYWMEGPHIRLRLRPRKAGDEAELRRRIEREVDAFLTRRPALYQMDQTMLAPLYKQMFLAEYTEQEWQDRYGDGDMPMRDNNSYAYIPYEPEYDRYGGPAGIEISEWHFEQSSDMVMRLLETTNVHVRTVMFGLAAQLMTATAAALLGDRTATTEFMDGYRDFWETAFQEPDPDRHARFDQTYVEMVPELTGRVREICDAVLDGGTDTLTGFTGVWAAHCAELRSRIVAAVEADQLIFPARDGSGRREPLRDPNLAMPILLSSYLHMTNNRLGVSIVDEVYLAYLLHRAMTEAFARNSEPEPVP